MNMKPSILIIVQNLPVPIDRRVWLQATTLHQQGYQVNVICPTGQYDDFQKREEIYKGISIYRYPAPPDGQTTLSYIYEFLYCWLWTFVLSLKVWWQTHFRIIQFCNPPETYFLMGWIYCLLGVQILFDHHDLSPEMYITKGGKSGSILHRLLLLFEFLTLRSANHIMTTNITQKQIAIKRANVPKNKITIVRSAPSLDTLYPVPTKPELKSGKPYMVAYLGEICSHDSVENIVFVASHIVQTLGRDDIHFVILGGGPALQDVKRVAKKINLDEYLTFLGRVHDETIRPYLSTADVCIIPDNRTDYTDAATMNKVMEYMAFGKPIVGFKLRENAMTAGDAAIFAEPNNIEQLAKLVITLIDDPQTRQTMGEYGRQRFKNHLSWEHSIPQLLHCYERLLNKCVF